MEESPVRLVDLLGLALGALFRQKVRTVLTTLGVLFGSFVLVASLSIRTGVHETLAREYRRFGELRTIQVYSNYQTRPAVPTDTVEVRGTMSDARRERLRREIGRRQQSQARPEPGNRVLTRDRLRELAGLEHVLDVEPYVVLHGYAALGNKSAHAVAVAALPNNEALRGRLVAGDFLDSATGHDVVVSEHLLYQLGIVDESDVVGTLGRRLRLEQRTRPSPSLLARIISGVQGQVSAAHEKLLDKVLQQLPGAVGFMDLTPEERALARKLLQPPTTQPAPEPVTFAEEFTIRGVVRAAQPGDEARPGNWLDNHDAEVFVPTRTAEELHDRIPQARDFGFPNARIEVDDVANVKGVVRHIEDMGLQTHSLAQYLEREQFIYLVIFSGMTVVALIALLVAALGIINTMLMSVLERVREIGIMKAVGARGGHIQLIFLVEGALIGIVGGCLGVLLAWAASFPADDWVRSMIEQQVSIRLEQSIFVFPSWLVVSVPLFATGVTTLAAFYPARRAARVNPIAALRHD
jgi:putative ABC transport system permease protein